MKTRDGHVSNSSSSSFVLLTTKENYEKALKDATPYQRAVAEALKEEGKFAGIDVVGFSTFSDRGGGGTFEYLKVDYKPEKDEVDASEAWDEFQSLIKRDESAVFSSGSDW